MRIGIFGGTFNPPHNGHIRLAKLAAEYGKLDKIIIIPSNIPPHKVAGSPVDGETRLQMCRIAFSEPIFEISDMELKRGDRSYTVDTLRQLKKDYPGDELFFIMGSDMLETFTQWYRWEEILSLATIIAVSRKNGFRPDLEILGELKNKVEFMDAEPFEVSSTKIRCFIKSNADTSAYISPELLDYIKEKGLYDDEYDEYRRVLAANLDEARLYHSECVSESAEDLAKKYGADPQKAKLAGLLHDITKRLPADEQIRLIGEMTPLEKQNHSVWHQMSAPVYLRENKLTEDEEILDAVRWHTTGKAGMTLLSKIVYVADFISADRSYPDVETVRKLAYISLEHAILYTSRYTVSTFVKLDRPIHPATLDCYNDMLRHFGL